MPGTRFAPAWLTLAFFSLAFTLASLHAQPPIPPDVIEQFSAETFGELNYRLLTPASLAGDDQKFPLVLFLHGAGERGDDNTAQLTHVAAEFLRPNRRDVYPSFVVFPQCPIEKRWVETPWDLISGEGTFPPEPSETMGRVLAMVDELIARYPVDTSRVYVAGLSMGGQGSWFAAAAKPNRFAAMIEVCGGGDPSWVDRYAGIPIWAFHGTDDKVVPVQRGREMIAALANAGHHPEVRYTEYPGVIHDSWTQTFRRDDVFEWLYRQRNSPQ